MQIELSEPSLDEIAARVKQKLVVDAPQSCEQLDPVKMQYQLRLARILVKENISIQEAALLLNCSDGHLRNLIKKAKHKRTSHPIPFNDLDGVFTFNREELTKWSREPKQRPPKDKSEVQK
jgi:predicted DNA-binding protein (UPF0251 family)